MDVKKYFDLLGCEVKDKTTYYKGFVDSISFDLYGCIQASVRPRELDDKGQVQSGMWFDVSRLKNISEEPLMERPNFDFGEIAEGKKGPANLPKKK